jgi:hypothetical protein
LNFYFKNNRYMSIVHLYKNDEFDLHHERLFHIGEWQLLILLLDLWSKGNWQKKKKFKWLLTTITTHPKIVRHLYSGCIRIDNKIPSKCQSFTMATKDWFNSLIFIQWSCNPTWIVLMTIFNELFWYFLCFGIDFSWSRMRLIMSSKLLKKTK